MGRLILLAIAVAVLFWLLRRALQARAGHRKPPAAPGGAQAELVRCAHCAVHLPKGEARSADGRYYCSEEHLRLGPGRD